MLFRSSLASKSHHFHAYINSYHFSNVCVRICTDSVDLVYLTLWYSILHDLCFVLFIGDRYT